VEALRRAQRDLGGGGCFVDRDDKPLIDWGVLSAIAALVVAFGALAYVVGLLAMWIPASTETHDFALSWYATSLVPRTTVAGIGVRWTLVGSHLLFVFFLLPLLFLVPWLYRLYEKQHLNYLKPTTFRALAIDMGIAGYFAALIWTLIHVELIVSKVSVLPGLRYALLPIILVVVFIPHLVSDFREFGSISRPTKRHLLGRAALLILINFGASLLVIATTGQLSLPVVQVSGSKELKGGITGNIASHTEGFWYVFDREKNLCAIPDENVEIVRLWKGGPAEDNLPKPTLCPLK
jgi:hypothetical protein